MSTGIKCADCGKFIASSETEPGGGAYCDYEPLSEFGRERIDWVCRKCAERERRDAT